MQKRIESIGGGWEKWKKRKTELRASTSNSVPVKLHQGIFIEGGSNTKGNQTKQVISHTTKSLK